MTPPPDIRVIEGTVSETGEGLLWCARRHMLFWIDIRTQSVCAMDPEGAECRRWPLPDQPGSLSLTDGDALVVSLPSGIHLFDTHSATLTRLAAGPDCPPPNHRTNDSVTTRNGELFFGTLALGDRSAATGSLCHWAGATPRTVLRGLHVANGLAVSPDDRTLYVADTYSGIETVWRFDRDPESGTLSNREIFFDMRGCVGRPDGACVDVDGCYWVAGVGGSELLRIDPSGRLDRRIELPLRYPTKPCFGGRDLRKLYVASLRMQPSDGEPEGFVVELELGYQGLPEPVLRHARPSADRDGPAATP